MKKFFLLMLAVMTLLPGTTAAGVGKSFALPAKGNTITPILEQSDVATISPDETSKSMSVPPTRTVTDVIENPPEGKVLKLDRSGLCFTVSMDGSGLLQYDNSPAEIVECDNGDVYVQMPFFGFPMDTYIWGHREGNEVTFNLPQTVFSIDYGNGMIESYNATLGQFNGSHFIGPNSEFSKEAGLPEIPEKDLKIVLTVDEEGVYHYNSGLSWDGSVLNVEFGDTALCLCDPDGSWNGYAEVFDTWKPFNGILITPPEDLSTQQMGFTYNGLGHYVEVGFDNNKVYIKGLVQDFPDSWIEGTVEGANIEFKSGQYLGENRRYAAYSYFASATLENNGYMSYLDSMICNYDADTETIAAPENVAVLYNGASDYVHYIEMYRDLMIRPQTEDPEKTLYAPSGITFIDGYYASFRFSYSTLNREGYMLNPDNIYFKMYLDGEEFVFTTDEYITLEKDMTYVPITFNDYYDFMIEEAGTMRVGVYFQDFSTVGFKLFYIDGDVDSENFIVLGESEMATYETSKINDVSSHDSKRISSTKYYDLMGKEVSDTYQGICVRQVTFDDGNQISSKIIKK